MSRMRRVSSSRVSGTGPWSWPEETSNGSTITLSAEAAVAQCGRKGLSLGYALSGRVWKGE
jgi:hypothetical protein